MKMAFEFEFENFGTELGVSDHCVQDNTGPIYSALHIAVAHQCTLSNTKVGNTIRIFCLTVAKVSQALMTD